MQLQTRSLLAAAVLSAGVVFGASAASVDSALDKGVDRAVKAQKSQQTIDSIDDSIRSAEREYRGLIKENDGLKVYIQQLDKQLAAQRGPVGVRVHEGWGGVQTNNFEKRWNCWSKKNQKFKNFNCWGWWIRMSSGRFINKSRCWSYRAY